MKLKLAVCVCFIQNYLGLLDGEDVVEELHVETDQKNIDKWLQEAVAAGKEDGYLPEENSDEFIGLNDYELTMSKGNEKDGYTSYGIVCRKFTVELT